MTIAEMFTLIKLLLKFRSLEFVSHRKRDLIDEICIQLLERCEPPKSSTYSARMPEFHDETDIPF